MLALASAWIGLISLLIASTMLVYRPAFTDLSIMLVLYFGAPGAMCLGGVVLWAHRNDDAPTLAVGSQRLQAKAGIALALVGAAIIYGLVIGADSVARPC